MYYGTDGSFMDFIKEFLKNCIGIAGLSIVVLIPILFASLTENHEEEVAKIAGFILFFIVMPIIAGLAGLGFNSYD